MLVVAAAIVAVVEIERPKPGGAHQTAGGPGTNHKASTTTTAAPAPPPPVQSAPAPWRKPLPVPIAEPLVLPGPGNELLIVGGEVPTGGSGSGAFLMNTATGALHLAANLVAGVHEAAGASLGNEDYVFGGEAAAVTSTVQSFAAPSGPAPPTSPTTTTASSSTAAVVAATATGALPQPRAGSVAVAIGTTVYIVGGYAGLDAEGAVLATSDGGTFTTVAKLPVAVRDPAVAVAGGVIYVFGGARRGQVPVTPTSPPTSSKATTTSGPTSLPTTVTPHPATTWVPVADIQRVDPVTGQATVVGQLPLPLQGAAAVTIEGHVYVAGGRGPAGLNGTIWGFEPLTAGVVADGHLEAPVWGAGAGTVGVTAWLVGGESAQGQPVGSLQTFRPRTSSLLPPGPGSSRPTGATSTSPVPTG